MTDVTMVQAINMALMRAMADDDLVLILGQDVGVNGGVFRATEGLYDLYGADRVIDTPLAELGTTGVSVGLAAQGFRPIVEIQFMGFIYSAIDQLANHASRLRSRTRGRLTCPMVLRAPFGGGIHAPEHHSESAEAVFTNIPGLRVVIPSSPARAYGLLLAAIRDPDPVVFLEPKRLYRAFREPVEDSGTPLPLIVHGFVGWAACGALMGGLLATVSLTAALTGHAVGAPIIFAAVTAHLFLRNGGRPPIVVASTFTAMVVALDALIVAWLIQRSFAMFSSVLGTWLPFALIFVSVFVTGTLLGRGR